MYLNMISEIIRKTLLGALLSIVFLNQLVFCSRRDDIFLTLFAPRVEPLETAKTLELLTELYHLDPKKDFKDLLDASEISTDKCNLQSSRRLKLVHIVNIHTSLSKYLNDYRRDQFDTCSPNIRRKVQDTVVTLPERTRQLLEDLLYNVRRIDQNTLRSVTRATRVEAILNLLRSQYGKGQRKRGNLTSEGLESVMSACNTINSTIKGPLEFYDPWLSDSKVVEELDSFIIDWFQRTKFCSDLLSDADFTINKISPHLVVDN